MYRYAFAFFLASSLLAVTIEDQPELLPARYPYQVHEPLTHVNLALFPVTSAHHYDSVDYMTLDEGLASGKVEVKELGPPMQRRRPGIPRPRRTLVDPLASVGRLLEQIGPMAQPGGARVDRLALVNHSKKPLLLLAGEIVSGGKQDRVISKDRIVPPHSEPLPLNVFCVEPGRWHGSSLTFTGKSLMAAPKLRQKAAVAKDQQEVWDAGKELREGVASYSRGGEIDARAARRALAESSSYARLENSRVFKNMIDKASAELERDYERSLRDALHDDKNVVGVLVAINGEIVWADLFWDHDLFARYWKKLLRSYVVEALSVPAREHARASLSDAERYLAEHEGRQIIEIELGEYRLVQVNHPRYNIFQIDSLWEKGESPILHFSKLRKETAFHSRHPLQLPPMIQPFSEHR